MKDAYVIGIGETKMGKLIDLSLRSIIKEAGEKAIADAGITKDMIEAVYFGNFNGSALCNQSLMGAMVSEVLGLGSVPVVRTEGACASGSLAFRMGLAAIRSGMHKVVLIGGAEKMCHQPTSKVTSAIASAMDYEAEQLEGATFPGCFAMIANRYFHEYRNVKKEMAMVAVNAHKNATLNPDAQLPKEVSMEKVLNADLIADPFSVFDCSLVTDGSAFLVLADEETAKEFCKHRLVKVAGSGHAGDVLRLDAKKCLTSFKATKAAAKQAYTEAGMTPEDINFAEVHDCFTITQIINTEDLGFFEAGTGADAVAEGKIARDGEKPINVSGGLKAKGHPIGGTGISQMYEVVTQLRGEAGARQLSKAEVGMTHNLGGAGGVCVVNIFKGE